MAEALLRVRASRRVPHLTIGSFGRMFEDEPAHRHARAVVAERGADLEDFRSRRWSADRLSEATLVLTMERAHVRDLALLEPGALARTFTLPEFVRLATEAGPRRPDEPLDTWIERVGRGRDPSRYLHEDPADEIADPIGESRRRFRASAAEIDHHLERLVELAWPARSRPTRVPPASRARVLETGAPRTR